VEFGQLLLMLEASVWQQLTSILCLMIILVPSAIGDYQRQRVPNWLSMSGWFVAPALAWLFTGLGGVGASLLGLALMVALLFPLWIVHWFGAADVKLIGTVGAFVGVSDSFIVLFYIVVTGMLMALLMLLYKGHLLITLNAVMRNLWVGKGAGSHRVVSDVASEDRLVLPYAIPIAFGTMFAILYLQLK
jgi:prepilin peptidase CpaA